VKRAIRVLSVRREIALRRGFVFGRKRDQVRRQPRDSRARREGIRWSAERTPFRVVGRAGRPDGRLADERLRERPRRRPRPARDPRRSGRATGRRVVRRRASGHAPGFGQAYREVEARTGVPGGGTGPGAAATTGFRRAAPEVRKHHQAGVQQRGRQSVVFPGRKFAQRLHAVLPVRHTPSSADDRGGP